MKEKWKKALLDALYPPNVVCPLCGEDALLGADGLCAACSKAARLCPKPAFHEPLDGLCAAYVYEGAVRDAIHRLKYQNATYFAAFFAEHIALPQDWQIDCIVPVPLHPLRKFLRGYNQSELLAKYIQKCCPKLPVRPDLLIRSRYTRSQTKLNEAQRKKNLRGAFVASGEVRGLSVLLVDDVATTRSTLSACAKELKKRGAKAVYAACAASVGP